MNYYEGIRTSKTVNGVKITYQLEGAKIVSETTNGSVIWYIYDENDMPVGIEYKGKACYFNKNAQGDVLEIVDTNGKVISGYIYDAWGNLEGITGDAELAKINPFRYRGYYQDNETGFYYLQSRYYDSTVGRFLNADDVMFAGFTNTSLSYNIFTYCENSLIIYKDSTCYVVETVFDVISILWNLADLIAKPSLANLGFLAWDIASVAQ